MSRKQPVSTKVIVIEDSDDEVEIVGMKRPASAPYQEEPSVKKPVLPRPLPPSRDQTLVEFARFKKFLTPEQKKWNNSSLLTRLRIATCSWAYAHRGFHSKGADEVADPAFESSTYSCYLKSFNAFEVDRSFYGIIPEKEWAGWKRDLHRIEKDEGRTITFAVKALDSLTAHNNAPFFVDDSFVDLLIEFLKVPCSWNATSVRFSFNSRLPFSTPPKGFPQFAKSRNSSMLLDLKEKWWLN